MTSDKLKLMPILILLLLCVGVFFRTLHGDFLSWDDTQHITLNPWLQNADLAHFWAREYYGLYIPVAYSLWTIVFKIWPSPMAFHLLNLSLHFLNCILVYLLALKILASSNMRGLDERARDHTPFALFTAALFAIHPLQVETVSWISAGRDIMSAFFGLSAVLAAWNTSDRLFPTWSATIRRVFATGLFILALLCKPGIVVLPLAVRWLSWFSERRGLKPLMMAFWIMLALVVAGLTSQIQQKFVNARLPQISPLQRPLIAADAASHYLVKFFVPVSLSADYGRTPTVALAQSGYWSFFALIAVFGVVLAVLALFHRHPPRVFWGALGFFIILLAPTLGLVGFSAQAISTVFDRYMYLPTIGLALALASLLTSAKYPKLEYRYLLAAIIVCLCAGISYVRVPVWLDDRSLHSDTLIKNPRSYQSLINLAIAELKDKKLDRAVELFTRARDEDPKVAVAWANLAHMYWLTGKNERILEEIAPRLNDIEFLEFNAQEPQALALMYRMWGRWNWAAKSPSEAHNAYCKAVKFNPYDKDLLNETAAFHLKNSQLPECDANL